MIKPKPPEMTVEPLFKARRTQPTRLQQQILVDLAEGGSYIAIDRMGSNRAWLSKKGVFFYYVNRRTFDALINCGWAKPANHLQSTLGFRNTYYQITPEGEALVTPEGQ